MRYTDLLESPRSAGPEADTSNHLGQPYPRHVRLIIRLMPSVYKELDLELRHGGPDATIGIHFASVRFTEPYDAEGRISQSCRNWIIMMVRDAALALGLSMCLVFAEDDVVYPEENGDLVIGAKAPQGGLRL